MRAIPAGLRWKRPQAGFPSLTEILPPVICRLAKRRPQAGFTSLTEMRPPMQTSTSPPASRARPW